MWVIKNAKGKYLKLTKTSKGYSWTSDINLAWVQESKGDALDYVNPFEGEIAQRVAPVGGWKEA